MKREELAIEFGEMKAPAIAVVRQYAKEHAPLVPADFIDALCNALGEISVDEAMAALDRFNLERQAAAREEARK